MMDVKKSPISETDAEECLRVMCYLLSMSIVLNAVLIAVGAMYLIFR